MCLLLYSAICAVIGYIPFARVSDFFAAAKPLGSNTSSAGDLPHVVSWEDSQFSASVQLSPAAGKRVKGGTGSANSLASAFGLGDAGGVNAVGQAPGLAALSVGQREQATATRLASPPAHGRVRPPVQSVPPSQTPQPQIRAVSAILVVPTRLTLVVTRQAKARLQPVNPIALLHPT